MHILPAIVCAFIGIVVAMITQSWVKRMPMHQSLRSTPNHCGNCGFNTTGIQRNSVLARLAGQRYCNHCDVALWPKFPGFELFMFVALGVVGARVGWAWTLPAFLVFFSTLVLITVIDLRHFMIPTRLINPSIWITFLLFLIAALVNHEMHSFRDAAIGLCGAWTFFFVTWFIYPAGMGFGDVRLSAAVGLASGFVGLANVVLSVFLAFVIGALFGVVGVILGRMGRKTPFPFGPFLAAGATVSILFGSLFAN